MTESDIDGFVSYWHDGTADLEFLGIDPERLGTRAETRDRFVRMCRRDGPRADVLGYTFCLDDTVIGFTNVNILGRPRGYMHVHLTDPAARGRGFLSEILRRSLPVLADHVLARYPIDGLVLETRTRNGAINAVLRKAGLRPARTGHLADPDGLAGPGEFAVFEVDAALIRELVGRPAAPPTKAVDDEVEYRLRLIRDDARHDDVAVAAGLVAAGFAALAPGVSLLDPAAAEDLLDRAGEHRSTVYDLWYRMKIPFGDADPDSWYTMALALGRTGGDVASAVHLHARVLERVASGEPPAAVLGEEFGLTGPLRTGGWDSLADAVAAREPFWTTESRPWLDRLHDRALRAWTGLREEDLPLLVLELQQRIEGLEQIRFHLGGELLDNRAVGAVLARCARTDPRTWDADALAVATLVWIWRDSGFCLQELNQSVISLPQVLGFLTRRIRAYAELLGEDPGAVPGTPGGVARRLADLRGSVERDNLRCLQFDGGNWERREFLVPRAACAEVLSLPADLRGHLQDEFGGAVPGDGPQAWAALLDLAAEGGRTPTDIVRSLGAWAVADDALPVDYAIFTVPMGVKLDRPWEFDYEDVFCYTAFSEAFDRAAEGVPFDHVGIANAIGQRLRYNVVKKAQNYALVRRFKAQSFNLPDIAVAEDANHGGHRAAGIRMSCRIPTHIKYEGLVWKGIADVRLNRTFYRQHLEFRPSDIPAASRLATWLGWIADAAYARGLLFDPVYGKKLIRVEETL
nr:GNAT family N-acetyltransferase [Actinocorallia herbida]